METEKIMKIVISWGHIFRSIFNSWVF